MAIGPRLDLRQTQSLVMTPQLRQAIQLLQFSNLEAGQFLEDELLQNPLLERAEGDRFGPAELEAQASQPPAAEALANAAPDALGTTMPLDTDFSNVYDPGGGADGFGVSGGGQFDFEDDDEISRLEGRPADLREHLAQQARLAFSDARSRLIAAALIAAVDPAGRLAEPPEAIAQSLRVTLDELEAIRGVVMRFDPTGICARNLVECLSAQLAERDRLDPAMAALLANLELLVRRDMRALMEICGVDAEDLADMIAEIKRLNPKPGAQQDYEPLRPLVPDVLMRLGPDDDYILELNAETMPRLLIRRGFHARMAVSAPRETKQFLTERMQSASFLVRALESRAQTILRVAGEIVRRQDAFFRFGVGFLRPLTLREIAEELKLHESTISRVTSNKVIATPRGVLEMKFFFTTALGGANGETHSAEAVRHRIGALIGAEPAGTVLSDDAVAQILQGEGIDIARRTVAKYREALRIPGSAQRKRDKAMSF
jgi:RNA polymerase sigma-54 factor